MELPSSSDTGFGLQSTPISRENTDNNEPVQLLTPMHLTTDTVHRISSATPFYSNGVKVWCATPLHIYSDGGKSTPLNVEPSQDLGQDFVQGWTKLPGEVKLNVLRFNLVHHVPTDYYDAFNGDGRSVPAMAAILAHHLRLLLYTKEFTTQ
jgi:hypothetical protein